MTQQVSFDFTTSAADALARMIEAKDPYTAGHTWRVANYGQILAAAMDYPAEKVEAVLQAGTLHDIGKIFLPDELLTKQGKLSAQEIDLLRRHPADGHALLRDVPGLEDVLDVVLMHHEAYDGSGYPRGLAGEAIPHQARLFAIVDAFDAMTSRRCYRPAMSVGEAVAEIERQLGRQFDPHIGATFIELCREGLLDHIVGYSDYGVKVGCCANCGPVLEMHNGGRLREAVACPRCGTLHQVTCSPDGNLLLRPAAPALAV
jgi:HD-GYP domain-containing protein (c-di-GMP phosphodiesterase class II)